MRKSMTIALLGVLLVGCGGMFGPAPDDPRFEKAYKKARQALLTASKYNANDYKPQMYQSALDRLSSARERQKNDPSEKLLREYKDIQIKANEVAIQSLSEQLTEIKNRLKEKQQSIKTTKEQLRKTKQRAQKSIQKAKKTIKGLREKVEGLKTEKSRLKARVSNLKDTAANNLRLQIMVENQREQIKGLKKKVKDQAQLKRRIEQLRNQLRELRRKNSKLVKARERLKKQNRGLRSRLKPYLKRKQRIKSKNNKIMTKLKNAVDQASVRRQGENVVVSIKGSVLFGPGDVHLKEEAESTLDKIADHLKTFKNREIQVEGHTDDLPIKNTISDKYPTNWELSARRSVNVVRYLASAHDLSPKRLVAEAYSQYRPIVPNNSTENRAKNRRVEITLEPRNGGNEGPQKEDSSDTQMESSDGE
ncbi:MAG: OmpA family protein [bacterium]